MRRDSRFELLRTLSMYLIILFHFEYFGQLWRVGKEKNFIDYVILSSYLPFGKIGVYLFVMITGYFLGNRLYKINKSINKAFIVWSEAFFYSLIIYLILVKVKLLHFSIKQFINACLPFTANQYWFVTAYIMLLLLLPFINRVIVVLNKRQYIYLIIIVSFLGSFLASIKNSTFASEISFGYLIPPYLIGGYLNKYKVNINWLKSKIIFLYLLTVIIGAILLRFNLLNCINSIYFGIFELIISSLIFMFFGGL